MKAWDVYRGTRKLTTVFFVVGMRAEEVRRGLINHDGFPEDITVL